MANGRPKSVEFERPKGKSVRRPCWPSGAPSALPSGDFEVSPSAISRPFQAFGMAFGLASDAVPSSSSTGSDGTRTCTCSRIPAAALNSRPKTRPKQGNAAAPWGYLEKQIDLGAHWTRTAPASTYASNGRASDVKLRLLRPSRRLANSVPLELRHFAKPAREPPVV